MYLIITCEKSDMSSSDRGGQSYIIVVHDVNLCNKALFAHHFTVTSMDMWWISVPPPKGCGYLEGHLWLR